MALAHSIRGLLAKYRKVGVDTAAFIYHFEENERYLPFTNVLGVGVHHQSLHITYQVC